MVLLARELSTEDFGIFNFYLTFFYIFLTIIDFGTNTIAVRETSKAPERLPGMLVALMQLRGGLSFLCMLAVWGVAFIFERKWNVRLLVCLAAVHLLFHTFGGFSAVFHVRMRFGYIAFINGLGHTLFLLVSAVALLLGCKNPAVYLIAFGAGMALTNIANGLMSRRFIDAPLKGAKSELGRLFREALPLGISSIMVTVYFYIDTVLLRPLKGEAAVGYYNAAYRMLVFSLMVPVLFNQVIFPVFSRCFQDLKGEKDRIRRIFRRAVLYMGVTGIPAAVALLILARPLVVLVCGADYARSSTCLWILGLAMASIFLTYPHISMLVASGRQVLFAWIAGCSGVVNLGLNLVLIPRYSIEGAAWATVATESLVLVCAVYCVRRFTKMKALDREFMKIPAVASAVGVAGLILQDQNLFWALPVLAAIYIGSLYAVKLLPFDIRDETGN
jgi:O-antigen/teichoic acid export membrane protein